MSLVIETLTILAAGADATPPPATPALTNPATVCPSLPEGLQAFADMFLGWAKGFFVAVLPISTIVCLLTVLCGYLIRSPRAGQLGATGLAVVFATTVAYGVVWGIIKAVLGNC